jgi:hypothetical protein
MQANEVGINTMRIRAATIVVLLMTPVSVMADVVLNNSGPKSAPLAPEVTLIRKGRPPNLYRNKWQRSPELCSKILKALNEPYQSKFLPNAWWQIHEFYLLSDVLLRNSKSITWDEFDGYNKDHLQIESLRMKRCFHHDFDGDGVKDTIVVNHSYQGHHPKYMEGVFIKYSNDTCTSNHISSQNNLDSQNDDMTTGREIYRAIGVDVRIDIYDVVIVDGKPYITSASSAWQSSSSENKYTGVFELVNKAPRIMCVMSKTGILSMESKNGN